MERVSMYDVYLDVKKVLESDHDLLQESDLYERNLVGFDTLGELCDFSSCLDSLFSTLESVVSHLRYYDNGVKKRLSIEERSELFYYHQLLENLDNFLVAVDGIFDDVVDE